MPISLVNSLLGFYSLLSCLIAFTGIYSLVLSVVANQAVHGYETGKAVLASVGVPLILTVVIGGCIALLVVLGITSLQGWADQFGMVLLSVG